MILVRIMRLSPPNSARQMSDGGRIDLADLVRSGRCESAIPQIP
jgi:hypothetical protein